MVRCSGFSPGRRRWRFSNRSAPRTTTSACRADLSVVAELEGDAEVVLAQHADGVLELVLRRRTDAHLIRLDRGLHFLQFPVFDELDDLAGGLDGNTLLDGDDAPDLAAGG